MAIFAPTSTSKLQSSFIRFDAEFFKPEFAEVYEQICAVPGVYLLGKITERITQGSNPKFTDKGLPCVNGKNVYFGTMTEGDPNFVSTIEFERLSRYVLRRNDLVITLKHATKIGRTWIVEDDEPRIFSRNVGLLRLKDDSPIIPSVLLLYLWTKQGQLLLDRCATGGTTGQITLPMSELRRLPIPPISEDNQTAIDSLFWRSRRSIDKSIESYIQAQKLLESELRLDKLRFDKPVGYTAKFSELGLSQRADPEYFDPVAASIVARITEFDHITLGSSFAVGNGFPWHSKKFLNNNSGEPVVRIRNIKPTHIDIDELTSIDRDYARKVGFSKANKGEIVVGMDGLKYFYASVLEGDCYINQRVAHLKPLPNAKISSEYATFIINSRVGQAQLLRDMTIATTVGHITNRNISKLVIPYVSNEFHDKITSLIRTSISKRQESKQLLAQAKSRVEQLIEEAVQA